VLLAGSSKTAYRIQIFSIALCADYSFELISIVHGVPQFIGHNKIFLGSVRCKSNDFSFLSKINTYMYRHFVMYISGFDQKSDLSRSNQMTNFLIFFSGVNSQDYKIVEKRAFNH
jgi:hypothetical protein